MEPQLEGTFTDGNEISEIASLDIAQPVDDPGLNLLIV